MRDDTLLGEAIVITVTDMSCIAQYKGTESFSRSPFHFNRPIRFRLCLEQASFGFHMGLKLAVSSQIEYKCSRNENTQFTHVGGFIRADSQRHPCVIVRAP
jgi:hypothetical protein